MALSKYVLQPEDFSITRYEDWLNCEQAQRYDLGKGHRALWASAMHNKQLRLHFVDMAARCQWWAAYFYFVMSACQETLLRFLQSIEHLQPLLAQLLTMATQLQPVMLLTMANLQLPLPVLMQQYGILITERETAESLWKLITGDYISTMALDTAVGCQNGLLISHIQQQHFYVKQMRELCSTRRVAGLLQALVGQHQLTHLLPDDTIMRTLRTLLAGRRTHGCLGFATLIDADTVSPAAGTVPSAEPPSMAPPAGAAGASAAASSIKLPTCGLIAQDSILAVTSVPLTFNGPLTINKAMTKRLLTLRLSSGPAATPCLNVPALLSDLLQKPMVAFPKVLDLPVLGPNNLILPDVAMLQVALPIPFSLSVSYYSLDAGAQHQDVTDIGRDNETTFTGNTREVQPDNVGLPGPDINHTPAIAANPPDVQPDNVGLPGPDINHAPAIAANTPEGQPDNVRLPGPDINHTPAIAANTPEGQPEDVALPEPATRITTVDKPMEATCSNNLSSWSQLFCVRFGKTIAATGIAVASMLVQRPGALERL